MEKVKLGVSSSLLLIVTVADFSPDEVGRKLMTRLPELFAISEEPGSEIMRNWLLFAPLS